MARSSTDISAFATKQLSLLSAEQDAEVAETALLTATHAPTILQRAGLALLNLHISAQRTGFGGKTLLELSLDPAIGAGELPEHGLRVGDICAVAEQPKGSERKKEREGLDKNRVSGVVTRVRREDITIALDKEDADVPTQAKLWLLKLANESTHKRLHQVMTRLSKLSSAEASSLANVLFGIASPTPLRKDDLDGSIVWRDNSLNDSQMDAIRFALASQEIALIHGPPGTGKTHTLIELILQSISRKQRVLVCGPSNISVDNIVERLASHKIPMVRLGHPARLLPSVLNHSLDILTRTSDAAAIVQDIRTEMDSKQASIRKTRSGRERKVIYNELKDLRREFRQRETKVVSELLRSSKVVLATLHGAGGHHLKDENFDVVIIDEASQALEAQCWIPVMSVKGVSRLVLAGDHLQLPPTIKSTQSKSKTKSTLEAGMQQLNVGDQAGTTKADTKDDAVRLETTLFDRLLSLHGTDIKRMLTTQYRMHELIMQFPSKALYEDKLIAAEHVKTRLLKDLPYTVSETDDTTTPLVFFDTQGGDFPETLEDDSETGQKGKSALFAESKVNNNEAALVRMHTANLIDAGVAPQDIAVVTPYNGQLALLAALMKDKFPDVELGSVDGFQGREKEAIIISLVRSNPDRETGFLSEKRRLNVAMTRPKRHLCVIGDSETISRGSKFLKSWVSFLEEEADLRYPDIAELSHERG